MMKNSKVMVGLLTFIILALGLGMVMKKSIVEGHGCRGGYFGGVGRGYYPGGVGVGYLDYSYPYYQPNYPYYY